MDRLRGRVNVTQTHNDRSPLLRPLRAALLLGLLLPAAACSIFDNPKIARGHRISDDVLAEIRPGLQSKADIQTLLGSPSATGTFDDSSWYYISAETRLRPGRALAVYDQTVVAIDFDDNGKVKAVRRVTDDQADDVPPVARETPTPGSDRTLLQALFGNVGRFNPLGGTAAQQSLQNPGARPIQ